MKNNTQKVVVLENISSPYITKAIFFITDNANDNISIVSDAERIVDDYLADLTKLSTTKIYKASEKVKKRRRLNGLLYFALLLISSGILISVIEGIKHIF